MEKQGEKLNTWSKMLNFTGKVTATTQSPSFTVFLSPANPGYFPVYQHNERSVFVALKAMLFNIPLLLFRPYTEVPIPDLSEFRCIQINLIYI